MRDINKKFSVRYYLNLVLMDTEDRRYFKQQEITLWRKGDKVRKPNVQSPMIQGTQNLSSEQQKQAQAREQAIEKEEFTQSPNAAENVFEENQDGLCENQIQNMTREAGDGQQNDGAQSNSLE